MKTLVILVNRNNKRDTIECLESLRRCEGSFDVWVSDNASSDGSIEAFKEWASGRAPVEGGSLWKEVEAKPILVKDTTWRYYLTEREAIEDRSERWVTFVSTGGSRGFPAGNNLGLRFGLSRNYSFFWILNNDTVVDPKALTEMLARFQEDRSVGVCGSTVVFYNAPTQVQALGGAIYYPSKAHSALIGFGAPFPMESVNLSEVESTLDYVYGASMLVSREFVERVGLMNEDLYLYFDEMDWAIRMNGKFRNGYAQKSIVFHKHGGTVGQTVSGSPSRESVHFMTINKILFTKAHYPSSLWLVILNIGINIAKNILKGRPKVAWWMGYDMIYGFFFAKYPLGC